MFIFFFLLACTNPNNTKDTDEHVVEPTESDTEASIEQDPQALELVAGVQEYALTQVIDGELVERPVYIHVPSLFDSNTTYPVLLVFHGNGSNEPNGIAESSIPQHAEMVNSGAYIGVYPQGHFNSWNLGQEQSTADDVAFVSHIVAQLKMTDGVNPDRIFATGFSNGAGLTQHLAVHTELFQAVSPLKEPY